MLLLSLSSFSYYISYSMEGGELFQRIQDRQDEGPFTERGKTLTDLLSFNLIGR